MKKILSIILGVICLFGFTSCGSKKSFDERVSDFNNISSSYKQVDVVIDASYEISTDSSETLPSGFVSTYIEYSIAIDYQNLKMSKEYSASPDNRTGSNQIIVAEGNDLLQLSLDDSGLVINEHVLNTDHENPDSDFAEMADKLTFPIAPPEMDILSLNEDESYEFTLTYSDLVTNYPDIASTVYASAANLFYNDCTYTMNFSLKEDHYLVTITSNYEDTMTGIINHFSMTYDTYYPDTISIIEYHR